MRNAIKAALADCTTPTEVGEKFEQNKAFIESLQSMVPSAGAVVATEDEDVQDGMPVFDSPNDVIKHFSESLTGEDWFAPQKKRVFSALCDNYMRSDFERNIVVSHTKAGRQNMKVLVDAGLSTDLVIVPQVLPIATKSWDKVIGQELVTVFPVKLPQGRVPKLDFVFEDGSNSFVDYLDYSYTGPIAETGNKPYAKISMSYADITFEKKSVDFRWSLEQDQDFAAMYSMSVQDALVQATAQRLAIETDLAIVTAINNAAVAGGLTLTFGTTPPTNPTTTIEEWWNIGFPQYVSTIKQMVRDASHMEPNFVICGTSAARLWEVNNMMQQTVTTPTGFREAEFGIQFAGYSKGDNLRIYTSPQVATNRMIFGVRTNRADVYGVMFCPYIPSYLTDTVTYPRSNEYEKAMGTRFGMVTANNNFYGYIDVEIGTEGSWLM
jgi:hypothetical protein